MFLEQWRSVTFTRASWHSRIYWQYFTLESPTSKTHGRLQFEGMVLVWLQKSTRSLPRQKDRDDKLWKQHPTNTLRSLSVMLWFGPWIEPNLIAHILVHSSFCHGFCLFVSVWFCEALCNLVEISAIQIKLLLLNWTKTAPKQERVIDKLVHCCSFLDLLIWVFLSYDRVMEQHNKEVIFYLFFVLLFQNVCGNESNHHFHTGMLF